MTRAQLEISSKQSVAELEALIASAHNSAQLHGATLRLASKSSKQFFADIWAAISVGTAAHHFRNDFIVKTWGLQEMPAGIEKSAFANSLPGLCALQMASSVMFDSGETRIPNDTLQRIVSIQRRGVLEDCGGSTRTLIEFDPQQPVARCLLDKGGTASVSDRRRLFRQLILRFRADLEIGALTRGISPVDAGPVKHLTSFLAELHENAYEHGRQYAESRRQLRIVRLRKHVSISETDMLRRAGHVSLLQKYLKQIMYGPRSQAVLEASISDFGLGIVDHFLTSAQGRDFHPCDRKELLERLLLERLSAKGIDPGAGRGIENALKAAKEMSAFVSLRTGEFWLAQAYTMAGQSLSLTPVQSQPLPKVRGTHWQFLWPQPV